MASTASFLSRRRAGALPCHPHALARAAALALVSAGVLVSPVVAQQDAAGPAAIQTVTVSGRSAANSAGVAGFGDVPLARSPFSATVISTRQLLDAGIASLGDITRLDAAITDAYNAPGYWNQWAVRGFTVDARQNLRRDGLPINGETVVPTGNKSAIEVLKGTSGVQAGTSAPGGLVNLVVARPVGRLRSLTLDASQPGSMGAALDLGDTAGAGQQIGWRLHLDGERLDPAVRHSRGERWLGAGAVEWRITPNQRLEAEFETSRQRQPSTPGFSLLGNRLPDAAGIDPRTNLNNQPWSLPVVFSGRTGSLRYTLDLDADTRLVAHAMRQRLDTDDRIAFPFGCSAENNYDRYCSDGSFDLYDFRSEGERRTSDAADLSLEARTQALGMRHDVRVGLLATRFQARFNRQAYNWVGTGTLDGRTVTPPDPALTDENTHRDERSTEWHLQDRITLAPRWELWAGLRASRIERRSVRTDGSRPTDAAQTITTPWLALSHAPAFGGMAYASAGQGAETEVVPNRPSRYSNAGQSLPTLKSRQVELGFKQQGDTLAWGVAAFDIRRPAASDIGGARVIDGAARHRGIEGDAEWRSGALSLRGSATLLQARREGSAIAMINGLRPTNVPQRSLKLQAAYNVAQVPGLALLAFVTHEGDRPVLPDNSLSTPGWTRLDAGLRWRQAWPGATAVWRLGIDNLTDRRAWKEAPYQYDHAWLYPLAPRSIRASVQLTM